MLALWRQETHTQGERELAEWLSIAVKMVLSLIAEWYIVGRAVSGALYSINTTDTGASQGSTPAICEGFPEAIVKLLGMHEHVSAWDSCRPIVSMHQQALFLNNSVENLKILLFSEPQGYLSVSSWLPVSCLRHTCCGRVWLSSDCPWKRWFTSQKINDVA